MDSLSWVPGAKGPESPSDAPAKSNVNDINLAQMQHHPHKGGVETGTGGPGLLAPACPGSTNAQTADAGCPAGQDGSIVALLITDYRETLYGPEQADNDRLDARQEKLHRETRFEGQFVFTNGMEWRIYYPDGPVEWFIPTPFTLHQPDKFWELFMLSLTE